MKKYIGAHVSASGGIQNAPLNAMNIGANAFALFTKNQRQWKAKPLNNETVEEFIKNLALSGISPDHVLPHDSYLINLGHPDEEKRKKSFIAFVDELKRCKELKLKMLNFHPGSHLGIISEEACLDNIIFSINRAAELVSGVTMVIENTAGQGSNIGYCFKHLNYLLNGVKDKTRVGICLDTCHLFASGYDIRNEISYNRSLNEFDKEVGISFLKGMHLNDSKKPLGSRVDRHESIGRGEIGAEAFRLIMKDPRLDNIPFILETPEPEIWPEEIRMLKNFIDF